MATIGFIGTGTIAAAMVQGIRNSSMRAWPIILSPRNDRVSASLAAAFPDVTVASSNQDVADGSDLVILAVRPQVAEEVLSRLAFRPDHVVISLIAGLDHHQVANWTGAGTVCRAIPLPFIALGRDATPVFPPDPQVTAFFNALGQALPVTELADFNTFAALSAMMATFFGIAEIAGEWGATQGLDREQAQHYIAQLFGNLSQGLQERPLDSVSLRTEHSTKGGLNEQLFEDFCRNGGKSALTGGLDAILRRVAGQSNGPEQTDGPSGDCGTSRWLARSCIANLEALGSDGMTGKKTILPATLDSLDLAILAILQKDNKTPQRAIAEQVHLSAPAVQRRIARMEETGVITANVAIVDPMAVDRSITIFVEVEMESERAELFDAAKRSFASAAEVQQCYYVTGEADFILIITVRDMTEYEALTRRLFFGNNNVKRFRSFVSMDRVKVGLELPI